MNSRLDLLRLAQTERALAASAAGPQGAVPPSGWLRAVREALGRSLRAQAARVGVAAPTLHKAEAAEAQGRITMAQLRKLADALDCDLAYTLVPRQPLGQQVQAQAERLARQEVLGVTHSMRLEAQEPSADYVAQQVADRTQALLAGPWSRLWR